MAMINPSCSQPASRAPATSAALAGSVLSAVAAHIAAKLAPSQAIMRTCCSIESTARKCGANSLRQTRGAVGACRRVAAGGAFFSERAVQIAAQLVDIDLIRNVGTIRKIA